MSFNQSSPLVEGVLTHAKEFYQTHSWGQHALAVILVLWAGYIIRQLVCPCVCSNE
jgi:hypothetical protein